MISYKTDNSLNQPFGTFIFSIKNRWVSQLLGHKFPVLDYMHARDGGRAGSERKREREGIGRAHVEGDIARRELSVAHAALCTTGTLSSGLPIAYML